MIRWYGLIQWGELLKWWSCRKGQWRGRRGTNERTNKNGIWKWRRQHASNNIHKRFSCWKTELNQTHEWIFYCDVSIRFLYSALAQQITMMKQTETETRSTVFSTHLNRMAWRFTHEKSGAASFFRLSVCVMVSPQPHPIDRMSLSSKHASHVEHICLHVQIRNRNSGKLLVVHAIR